MTPEDRGYYLTRFREFKRDWADKAFRSFNWGAVFVAAAVLLKFPWLYAIAALWFGLSAYAVVMYRDARRCQRRLEEVP